MPKSIGLCLQITALASYGMWAAPAFGQPPDPAETKPAIVAKKSERPAARVEGFRVTMPDGTAIELVGLGEHPKMGGKWWRPDGLALAEPFDRESGTSDETLRALEPEGAKARLRFREVAVRLRKPAAATATLSISSDSWDGQGFTRYLEDGNVRGSYYVPTKDKSLVVKVAYSSAPWKLAASADSLGVSDQKEVVFAPLAIQAEGLAATVKFPLASSESRIFAVDKSGKTHYGSANHQSTEGKLRLHGCRFFGLRLVDLAAVHLETRPVELLEFRGVALNLDDKATPRILLDGVPVEEK